MSERTRLVALSRIGSAAASTGTVLSAKDALRLGTACSLRCGEEAVGLMFARPLRAAMATFVTDVALTADEYVAFYGIEHAAGGSSITDVHSVAESVGGARRIALVRGALEATLAERGPRDRWASPVTQCATSIAVNLHESHDALVGILGDVLFSDRRPLDDLRADEDDLGVDLCTLVRMIDAIASDAPLAGRAR
jgi:hypothetical protein